MRASSSLPLSFPFLFFTNSHLHIFWNPFLDSAALPCHLPSPLLSYLPSHSWFDGWSLSPGIRNGEASFCSTMNYMPPAVVKRFLEIAWESKFVQDSDHMIR